jgi:hypothetical protein
MIELVSATRLGEDEFWKNSALGVSLLRLAHAHEVTARVFFQNGRGLPEIYNSHIRTARPDSLLVFVHDDVWIEDNFFASRVTEGLQSFGVIGIAGNRRRVANQPAWAFKSLVGNRLILDEATNLSGTISHGNQPFGKVEYFGPAPVECELMDGVLLAARRSVLIANNVYFDPQFYFHFYDLDFCRSARLAGVKLGTWPISVTHQSDVSAYGSPAWIQTYPRYIEKWGE